MVKIPNEERGKSVELSQDSGAKSRDESLDDFHLPTPSTSSSPSDMAWPYNFQKGLREDDE